MKFKVKTETFSVEIEDSDINTIVQEHLFWHDDKMYNEPPDQELLIF